MILLYAVWIWRHAHHRQRHLGGPPRDKTEALRVLKRAVELGSTLSIRRGQLWPHVSEELIAEALYPYPPGLVIATKGGLLRTGPDQWPVDASPDHLKEALEGSLARLNLDRIDLYQLHRIDPKYRQKRPSNFYKASRKKVL